MCKLPFNLFIYLLQPEYFLKWLNFSRHNNSWEPKVNLNCDELLREFEKKRRPTVLGNFTLLSFIYCQADTILSIVIDFFLYVGAKRNADGLFYLMKFADIHSVEEYSSNEAADYWPQKVIEYLQLRCDWIHPNNVTHQSPDPIETTADMVGDPDRITCKKFS